MSKQDKLDNGKIESLVASLRPLASSHPGLAKLIRTEADYFQTDAERMRYPKFRRQKLFVGSGVIEAGCKTIACSGLGMLHSPSICRSCKAFRFN